MELRSEYLGSGIVQPQRRPLRSPSHELLPWLITAAHPNTHPDIPSPTPQLTRMSDCSYVDIDVNNRTGSPSIPQATACVPANAAASIVPPPLIHHPDSALSLTTPDRLGPSQQRGQPHSTPNEQPTHHLSRQADRGGLPHGLQDDGAASEPECSDATVIKGTECVCWVAVWSLLCNASGRGYLAVLIIVACCVAAAALVFVELRSVTDPAIVQQHCSTVQSSMIRIFNNDVLPILNAAAGFAAFASPLSNATYSQFLGFAATETFSLLHKIQIFQEVTHQQRADWEATFGMPIFDLFHTNRARVTAPERNTYWPGALAFVPSLAIPPRPEVEEWRPMGYDPYGDFSPVGRRAAIDYSMATGSPGLTAPIPFIVGDSGVALFQVVNSTVSIMQKNGTVQRARVLIGMSLRLFQLIGERVLDLPIDLDVVDNEAQTTMYSSRSRRELERRTLLMPVTAVNRVWTLKCMPVAKYPITVYRTWSYVTAAALVIIAFPLSLVLLALIHKLDQASQVRRELAKSRSMLRGIRARAAACIQAMPHYLVVLDAEGNLVAMNHAASTLFAAAPPHSDEMRSVRSVILDPPLDNPDSSGTRSHAPPPVRFPPGRRQVRVVRPDGSIFPGDLIVSDSSPSSTSVSAHNTHMDQDNSGWVGQVLLLTDISVKVAQLKGLEEARSDISIANTERRALLRLWCRELCRLGHHISTWALTHTESKLSREDRLGMWCAGNHIQTLAKDTLALSGMTLPNLLPNDRVPLGPWLRYTFALRNHIRGHYLDLDLTTVSPSGSVLLVSRPAPEVLAMLGRVIDLIQYMSQPRSQVNMVVKVTQSKAEESEEEEGQPLKYQLALAVSFVPPKPGQTSPESDQSPEPSQRNSRTPSPTVPPSPDSNTGAVIGMHLASTGAEFRSAFTLPVIQHIARSLKGAVSFQPASGKCDVTAMLPMQCVDLSMTSEEIHDLAVAENLVIPRWLLVTSLPHTDSLHSMHTAAPGPSSTLALDPSFAQPEHAAQCTQSDVLVAIPTPELGEPPPSPPPPPMYPVPFDPPVNRRVLVVEDNNLVRRINCSGLKRLGFTTIEANSGEAAVAVFDRILRGTEPNVALVLMDLVMPGIDGITAAGKIRALGPPAWPVAIVAFTANAIGDEQETVMSSGHFCAFYTKGTSKGVGVLETIVSKWVHGWSR